MINANHRGYVVTHGIHGVMAFVAMKCPVAFLVGEKVELAHLAHCDIGGDLWPARALRNRPAVCSGDHELMAVNVNGMVGHGEVAETHPHLVVLADDERINTWEDTAIPSPKIEVDHGHNLRGVGARIDIVGVQQDTEVTIYLVNQRMFGLGMGDPKSHHAHRHLRHFIGMGVVHKRARAPRHKFIDKRFSGLDRGLI